ncbi:hypothetical protein HGRIS_004943 [Hohenbuehelia grisea]|uniref:tRNA pseudouridine synthase n=1 Tax=Hohenbuehelia grisea TaxID=104357 RepID=A0ABR3JDP7_9AGAR
MKHALEVGEPAQSSDAEATAKRAKLESDTTPTEGPEAQGTASAPGSSKGSDKKRDAAGWPKSRRGKEKNAAHTGRRRRGARNDEADAPRVDAEGVPLESKGPRYPKRQCAVLMSYCGTGCSGMQIQKNARTIEGILFDAMVKAGAVSDDNADDPTKVNLGRAARTDAGVHAAGNIVSMKLITTRPDVPDILARINEELPPEIRVWEYVRVQNSFNARIQCDSRKYTYFFPTYLLLPPKPGSALIQLLQEHAASVSDEGPATEAHPFWSSSADSLAEDLRRKRAWRVSPEQVEQLREAGKKYEGTHNFHNFTVGSDFKDRSSQRHMKRIEFADPVVYGETEWISVLFHGQSFMLHQIVRNTFQRSIP